MFIIERNDFSLPFSRITDKLTKLGPIFIKYFVFGISKNKKICFVLFWYLKRKLPSEWFVWFEVEISSWKKIFLKKKSGLFGYQHDMYFELKTVWLNVIWMTPCYHVYVSRYVCRVSSVDIIINVVVKWNWYYHTTVCMKKVITLMQF